MPDTMPVDRAIPAPLPEAIHLPFEAGPFRMAMGLTACPAAEWIELDERYVSEMALRRTLLAERHADVFAAVPESAPARAETLEVLAAHLTTRYPGWFTRDGAILHNHLTGEAWDLAAPSCDPLELAGRLVQEDLCLVELSPDGPILTAAVLCFPSRWRLLEKIGRPLALVHANVPIYPERLSNPVDRFMERLQPGRIAMRLNWSLVDDPTMYQPTGKGRTEANPAITPETVPDDVFLRVERQTLSRLPRSNAVLFTIRVHSNPLSRIVRTPRIAADLAEAVRALPPEMTHYKSLLPYRPALLSYLDTHAAL